MEKRNLNLFVIIEFASYEQYLEILLIFIFLSLQELREIADKKETEALKTKYLNHVCIPLLFITL